MRKVAFGYSTRCNLKCEHCVAAGDLPDTGKMDFEKAKEIIAEMACAGVGGISFSAGEPFLYFAEISELVKLCRQIGIYTRIVTNSYWAATEEAADNLVGQLKENGLCQLRLSYSRWHQKNVSQSNVLNAARSCQKNGLNYFISFVTDFSKEDDLFEQFLRDNGLMFFPEPVIYAGRAQSFERRQIQTDYQVNCCDMNPYLSPDLDMYACCDAGSHFTATNFFYLGNLRAKKVDQLFAVNETDRLYNLIRTIGVTTIASYSGMKARDIITYSKCELCRKLFNSPATLGRLRTELSQLEAWCR
nr:radical SAM protein [Desulfobulbaceae bacterium]